MTTGFKSESRVRHRGGSRAIIAAVLLGAAVAAHAGADCSVSTTGLSFGVYDPLLANPDDAVATVTVTCSYVSPGGAVNVPYTLQLSAGSSGSYAQRLLGAGSLRLGYNLYLDAARTQVIGNGTGGTYLINGATTVGPGVGNGTRTNTYSIYGRVPALQDAGIGSYADTIVATLTF